MLKHFLNNKINRFWVLIGFFHLSIMYLLYLQFSFSTDNEGTKYLNEAQHLINGNLPQHFTYNGLFSSYVLYITIFKALHLPTILIFISTYIINLYAYNQFYMFLKMFSSKAIASIWLCMMLLCPLILYWQLTLFSESFYIAISLIFISYLFKENLKHKNKITVFLALILLLTRPSGIFTVLVFGLFYLLYQNKITLQKSIIFGFNALLLLFLIVFFFLPITYDDFALEITSGSVYCGFPTLPLTYLPYKKYTLWDCYHLLYQHYGLKQIGYLFCIKWVSFFNLNRVYYSNFHNLINSLHYFYYLLAFLSIISIRLVKNKLIIISAILIILNSLLIAITYNEWSERHTIEVFPFIFILAAIGLQGTYIKLKLRSSI